ncbi:hypothetical protein ACH4VR_14980 [Streptomyces sp. NPDC020883]|uniref:hypothetical protein n=1 Tax=unclassified Streptomyces TaxID=2593676 RepID=UPI0021B09568|nr:hypothetical protein [Streptomyces sp. BHT-5-2]
MAHNIASERFDRWNRVTGISTAMLSAVVGTTLFASLSTSGLTGVRVIAGTASLLAAALSAGQLVWNYPDSPRATEPPLCATQPSVGMWTCAWRAATR